MTQWQGSPSYYYATAPSRNTIGTVALVLAALGAVLALATAAVPALLFVAMILLLIAFVLSIVGVTRRGRGKTTSVIALVGSIVFGVVGPVMFAGRFVSDVGTAITEGTPPDTSQAATLGEAVTNSAGVAFTVNKVTCGKKSIKDEFGMKTKPKGEFCVVSVRIDNGSDEMVTLSASDVTGIIGGASYQADSGASDLGGDKIITNVNPGLGIDASLAIDVPKKATLEYVELRPTWSFQDSVVVKVQ
jgi:hypothetical protein